MSELPMNWKPAALSEICLRLVDGSHNPPKAVGQGFPMLSARNIQNRRINFDEFRFISDANFAIEHARTNVQPGDVLLTIVGAIGRSAVVPTGIQQFTLQRSVAVLKPLLIEPRYLSYALQSPDIQKYLEDNAKGTAQKGIYLGALSGVEIPVAPLNEQKRITDKLDVLLTRVDACRERLERVPFILKRLRQAILTAAMSGGLTEDWRVKTLSKPEQTWSKISLGACGSVSGGLTKNAKRAALSLRRPYLRVANVYANRLELNDVAEIGLTEAEYEKTKLVPDDLLIVEGNGSIEQLGRVALWNGEIDGCVHQNHLIRWRGGETISAKYVLFWLMSPKGRESLMALASTTTGLHTLSISKVSAVAIELPSIKEQREIVGRIETLFAYADRLETRYRDARARVEQLTPALLTKAFHGELVPQDPKDEPASVLLERIRASRATAEGAEEITRAKRRTNLVKKPKARIIMLKRKDVEPSHLSAILKANGPLSAEALWSASQLDIDEFYDQLKDEEAGGLLKENVGDQRLLEAA